MLRHNGLMPYLVDLLSNFGSLHDDLRRELLNTFSFLVYKAEAVEVFPQLVST
jgi:hypothetical protein